MRSALPIRRLFCLLGVSLLLGAQACESPVSSTETTAEQTPPAQAAPAQPESPHQELNELDGRTPVPLQPMMAWHQKQSMMEHLVAIEQITDALTKEDFEGVAKAAALIESSPEMQQMCQHMGAGAEGFTEKALDFHKRADQIGEAARAEDAAGVLKATAHTLQSCNSCHATYRQDIVNAETWEQITGSAHDPSQMHH